MWSMPRKRRSECRSFRSHLEDAASAAPAVCTDNELLASLPRAAQDHAAACKNCQAAVNDLLLARQLLRELPSYGPVERPWFVPRVMSLISAREAESRRAESAWVAVPRLASRLTWVTTVLLLVAGTWLYERPAQRPAPQATPESVQESIFEYSQPPAVSDDVLVSPAESER